MEKDYKRVLVIGFLVGWLVLLPLKNVGLSISPLLILFSVVGFTLLGPIALFILKLLGKKWPVFEQFGKFAAVGTLNTLLYLAVINFLILLTDISRGSSYSVFVVLGFLVATTNSYLWNKFWTFESKAPVTLREYGVFIGFTVVGTLINVGVASLIVNDIGAPAGVDPKLWANVGALTAVFVSFIWNFLAYRKIVFRRKNNPPALAKTPDA